LYNLAPVIVESVSKQELVACSLRFHLPSDVQLVALFSDIVIIDVSLIVKAI
jgi:hypothetical protein